MNRGLPSAMRTHFLLHHSAATKKYTDNIHLEYIPNKAGVTHTKQGFYTYHPGSGIDHKHKVTCCSCCCLPNPFRGMGAWRKTMEPQYWDPRKGQQPFRPHPNGAGDRTTTLRRLLVGADKVTSQLGLGRRY